MDLFSRYVGTINLNERSVALDVRELILRMLVSDTVILKTHFLSEVVDLVRIFESDGLVRLLESGRLQLTCESFTPGFGQAPGLEHEMAFQFLTVREGDRAEYLERALSKVPEIGKRTRAFRAAIRAHIAEPPDEAASKLVLSEFRHQLMSSGGGLPKLALAQQVSRTLRVPIDPGVITFRADQIAESAYLIYTNLADVCPHPEANYRDLIGKGLLSVAEIYARVSDMNRHNALVAASDSDLPMFNSYFTAISKAVDTSAVMTRFERMIELTGAPVVSSRTRVNANRLLRAAGSPEALEFRQWLRTMPPGSETEASRRVNSIVSRVGLATTSGVGKGLRWILSTFGPLLLPDGGTISGPVGGLLDGFVVDKLLSPDAPTLFLKRTYPSIFDSLDGQKRLPPLDKGAAQQRVELDGPPESRD